MPIGTQRLWRSRMKNGLQPLLIMAGLAPILAVPGYLLAGGFGVVGRWLATLFGRYPPAGFDWLRTHPPTEERIRRLMSVDEPPQPPLHDHHEDHAHEPPVINERPGPMGRRYWMGRQR
ncbi:hypothetical protein [Halomonas sp. 11-S5]|uniref:hypothetical protein n=1 Tax=Halomonas sp. 11-S5 TaxID=2994064 RepID=UPI0024689EC2|nr:hypothetical protein [Halomonas sp. 11-S5]